MACTLTIDAWGKMPEGKEHNYHYEQFCVMYMYVDMVSDVTGGREYPSTGAPA